MAGRTRKDSCILWPEDFASPKTRTSPKRNARRTPTRRRELPILPLVVGGGFLAVFLALVVVYLTASRGASSGQPVANIRCETGEQLAVHYHANLQILYRGSPVALPASVGVNATCLYWLHTHDDSGVIHVEAPRESAQREFTLGDFFTVWHQPLSRQQVATLKVGQGEQVRIWVNGQPYNGDPAKAVLKSHTNIVIQVGPPFVEPPPDYTWDTTQYAQ